MLKFPHFSLQHTVLLKYQWGKCQYIYGDCIFPKGTEYCGDEKRVQVHVYAQYSLFKLSIDNNRGTCGNKK